MKLKRFQQKTRSTLCIIFYTILRYSNFEIYELYVFAFRAIHFKSFRFLIYLSAQNLVLTIR